MFDRAGHRDRGEKRAVAVQGSRDHSRAYDLATGVCSGTTRRLRGNLDAPYSRSLELRSSELSA